jgi:hypothetical protein
VSLKLSGSWDVPEVAGTFLLLLTLCACSAGTSQGKSVLMAEPGETLEAPPPVERVEGPDGPIELPFRGPPPEGTAYRLILETSGDTEIQRVSSKRKQKPTRETKLVELEYRELPADSGNEGHDAYLVRLDGLHYRVRQRDPSIEGEIELGNDRLRVFRGGKVEIDLRGAQPREGLTPRMLLDETIGIVAHDGRGDPITIQGRGVPRAREFLDTMPIRQTLGYSRLPLPRGPVSPGSRWQSSRYPVNPAGRLGLDHEVEYTLAGFARLDGEDCAWILIEAKRDAEQVTSVAGFQFDRAVASLRGEAWVELATSRVRRLVLMDDTRASYTRSEGEEREHRMRYKSRLVLELRDPNASPDDWADGTPRFGRR